MTYSRDRAPSIVGSTLAAAPSQVTQTLVQTDATINNKVNIYVAGQGGILPPTVVAAINSGTRAQLQHAD